MSIKLSRENREVLVSRIQDFFSSERDEEIGIIAAEAVLDFFVNEVGDNLYNQGLMDAKSFFINKMDDLEGDFDVLFK